LLGGHHDNVGWNDSLEAIGSVFICSQGCYRYAGGFFLGTTKTDLVYQLRGKSTSGPTNELAEGAPKVLKRS
jgi:hypothetical protein